MEEVVVSVQGVLSKNGIWIATISEHDPVSQCQSYEKYVTDLEVSRMNSDNTRYLKQNMQITGYGNQTFERLHDNMAFHLQSLNINFGFPTQPLFL